MTAEYRKLEVGDTRNFGVKSLPSKYKASITDTCDFIEQLSDFAFSYFSKVKCFLRANYNNINNVIVVTFNYTCLRKSYYCKIAKKKQQYNKNINIRMPTQQKNFHCMQP